MKINIRRIKTSTQKLACSQCRIHYYRLSQAKTNKDMHASKVQAIQQGRQTGDTFTELLWLELVTENSRVEMKTQHTRELISARKTSHKYNNKDLRRLQYLSPGMRVNTRYINSTRATSSAEHLELK